MVGFVTIRKLITEFVGATFDARISEPPSPNIIDGSEDFFRSLVYRKCGGEFFLIRCFSPVGAALVPVAFKPPSTSGVRAEVAPCRSICL